MDALTRRPLLASDAAALLEIELAAEQAEPSENFPDLTKLQERLANPGVDLVGGSLAYLSGDDIVASGFLLVRPTSTRWTVNLFGAVLPEFRRRGLGREMLALLKEKAQSQRSAAGAADLPGDLLVWVPGGRDAASAFASTAGFVTRRYFVEMRAELAAGPAAFPLDGIEIRGWNPADDERTRLAYNAAFADHWGSPPMDVDRWRITFAESSFFRPELSRVAVAGREIVGFVLVAEFPAQTEARGYRTAYVDRVGSLRSVRGRGLAAAMLTDSMRAQFDAGIRYAELTVDADSPTGAGRLYERLGYEVVHTNVVHGLDF
ncbi:mycothiol synthase [Nakamurella sp. UYEF19]|uniref:GNAT family N-acetyltransferase n=1 Tax=Nakamurella sp. UYEF19 TaxID=1756392 RepID=UPI00339A6B46